MSRSNTSFLVAMALLVSPCGAPLCRAAGTVHACCAPAPQQDPVAGEHIVPRNDECACAAVPTRVVLQAYKQIGKPDLFAVGLAGVDNANGSAATAHLRAVTPAFLAQMKPNPVPLRAVLRI